jgi:hypothetical protein
MFNDYEDFYTLFEEHKQAFDKASTYEEFCALSDKEYLAGYKWAERVFATAKAGKRTYRPLYYPLFESFADLFQDAKFLPTNAPKPTGYVFLSGGPCMSVGGKRSWSITCPGTRAHYGSKFYGTYVRPLTEIHNHKMTLAEHPANFEMVKREDGILILSQDGKCIGSDWLALLPTTADVETLFDEESRQLLARERKAEQEAWAVSQ